MVNAQVSSDHREGSGADKQIELCVIGVAMAIHNWLSLINQFSLENDRISMLI
jgi:hypothetical protein